MLSSQAIRFSLLPQIETALDPITSYTSYVKMMALVFQMLKRRLQVLLLPSPLSALSVHRSARSQRVKALSDHAKRPSHRLSWD